MAEETHALEVPTLENLHEYLSEYEIDTSTWGTYPAKTVTSLFNESQNGESVMCVEGANLIRVVNRAQAIIKIYLKGSWYRLVEKNQIFSNNAERTRPKYRSISEKIKTLRGETPVQALIRGIEEELGIKSLPIGKCVPFGTKKKKLEMSASYPTLLTRHKDHRFVIILPRRKFKRRGYVEIKPNRTTRFEWLNETTGEYLD